MNIENIIKWVNALRSGKFKQGQGVLRDDRNRYCCLGVACEIAGIEYDEWKGLPPYELIEWLGLPTDRLMVSGADPHDFNWTVSADGMELAGLNDYGSSFESIARRIERAAAMRTLMSTLMGS